MDDTPKPAGSGFGFETRAVHAGAAPDPTTGARATPIYQTTAYVSTTSTMRLALQPAELRLHLFAADQSDGLGARGARRLARGRPRRHCLRVGPRGADARLLRLHGAGRRVRRLAEALWRLNHPVRPQLQEVRLERHLRRPRRPREFPQGADAQMQGHLRRELGQSRRRHHRSRGRRRDRAQSGIPLLVDNTLASPYLCRPIEWGADIVIHSTTKFLSGHGNSMGGVVVDSGKFDWSQNDKFASLTEPEPAYHGLRFHETFGDLAFTVAGHALGLRDLGATMAPLNAFLTITGIETLALRMERHVANAQRVAEFSAAHPAVSWVNYAGLPSSPYHALAKKYLPKGAGSVSTPPSASRAAMKRASGLSRAASCSRISPISATPAR